MRGRICSVSGHDRTALAAGWRLADTDAAAYSSPAEVLAASVEWVPATVPGTVADALRAAQRWSLDAAPRRFDERDFWYRCEFAAPHAAAGAETWLCCDGLATLADVWLNDVHLIASDNMFVAHRIRVDALLTEANTLCIRFRSLDHELKARRPRPRWRAPMVENQQLRFVRTTLLGRTPGWSPPAAPVGPWRAIWLEQRRDIAIEDVAIRARLDGDEGLLELACDATPLVPGALETITATLSRAAERHVATLRRTGDGTRFAATLRVPRVARWWPHTHGEPALYQLELEIARPRAAAALRVDLGKVGFRTVALDTANGAFGLAVNGLPVFCRGACWTPLDVVSLGAGAAALAAALDQVCAAGMNMLRVCGPMVYESDAFLDACDARGILLWQDFMFANMDYPGDDPAFAASAVLECRQLLARLQGRPSLAVLCGNSEVEQQAAMAAAPRDRWQPALFHDTLAKLARAQCPDVPYWPSSAHGGAFPHSPGEGTVSYYGVGAYLRPLEDARRAEVRFASECLGFANIPEPSGLADMPGGETLRVHHAIWKARSPRDLGAGWDFDDVRDHYLQRLYGVDPAALRHADHERYLELGRVATGAVMAATFAEWRRARSTCRGGLVFFLRDLWAGAGWGLVDAAGTAKAAYWLLRRALQPIALQLSDEGGGGIHVHAHNEGALHVNALLRLDLYRHGEVTVASAERALVLAPRASVEIPAAALFDGFLDLSYAYRFGSPSHEVLVATLRGEDATLLGRASHFPFGPPAGREPNVGLAAECTARDASHATVVVRTRRYAHAVCVRVPGYLPSDNYFDLPPGQSHALTLLRTSATGTTRGLVRALNAEAGCRLELHA